MNKKKIIIISVFILMVVAGIGGYFLLKDKDNIPVISNTKNIRKEVITAENYEEISNKIGEELKDTDDLCYFGYACMYYIMKDGFTEEYMTSQDETLLYKSIHNKTVQKLIDEGKQLMKDNNVTIEQYKQEFQNLEDLNDNENE